MTVLNDHGKYGDAVNVYSEMTASLRDHICNALPIKAYTTLGDGHHIQCIEEETESLLVSEKEEIGDISPVQSALIHYHGTNRCDLHKAVAIWNWNGNESKNRVLVNGMVGCVALRLSEEFDLKPFSITTSLALKAVCNLRAYDVGKELIARNIGSFRNLDVELKHSLIRFYGECGDLQSAQSTFDWIGERENDSVSINAAI